MQKTIVVTGGNRGIGREIVRQLAKLNHQVILACRNIKDGEEAVREFDNTSNIEVKELVLTDQQSIHDFAKDLYSRYEKIDVLINNAGVFEDDGVSAKNIDYGVLQSTWLINTVGPILLSQTILNLLKGSDEGRIINMSSGMGAIASLSAGGSPAYRISKAALNAYTQILSADLHDTNIKVNAMCPGWVKTDMGGHGAHRSVEKGAETAVWLATAEDIPNGKFLRDKVVIDW
ncbi:SDR family oxidoreductase [Fulvivirga sp. RKSG066]|uniref:SDR family oxidoreductase n=1 Tax=Fulvivirga aurantia TaxID=2529383 RepID=UPI0012BD09E5|nr:SDR family oxidoreductase [Fulvivirga aurantia]MTI23002.1 SDR family oxidoreductase [Fulvivirga aurantia]